MGASNHLLDFDTSLFHTSSRRATAALFFIACPIFHPQFSIVFGSLGGSRSGNRSLAVEPAHLGLGVLAGTDSGAQLREALLQLVTLSPDLAQFLAQAIAIAHHGGEHLAGTSPASDNHAAAVTTTQHRSVAG
jgi:hypothetical protein